MISEINYLVNTDTTTLLLKLIPFEVQSPSNLYESLALDGPVF